MQRLRIIFAFAMLVCLLCAASEPGLSQSRTERIPLIMSGPQTLDAAAYDAIRKSAADAPVQMLTLTKAQAWLVRPETVDAVEKTAARHGITLTRLGARRNDLFSPDSQGIMSATMTGTQKAMMDRIRASPATMGMAMVGMPRAAQVEYALTRSVSASPATQGEIEVRLNPDTVVTLVPSSVTVGSHMLIWRGRVASTGQPATFMWWPGVRMAGTIHYKGRIYSLRCVHGEMHAIVELSQDRMPPEHAPMPQRMRAADPALRDDPLVQQGDASMLKPGVAPRTPMVTVPKVAPPAALASADDIVINLVVAYTKKAASSYTDIEHELIDLAIENANQSFRNSGLPQIKLKLVHTYQTDYEEEGVYFDHLWRFADKGDGYMEEIHGLRDKNDADVAILIVDDPAGCGLATRVYADPDEAFAVVNHLCADATYSLAHEIGHLIGARHELKIDKIMKPFPYGHGYVNGMKWRDIMSYKESCGGCPRLPVWSNPNIRINGEPAGTQLEDNARVIAEQAARVANFRASRRDARAYSSAPLPRQPGTGTADPR